jgi:hypothetical protein
MQKQSTGECDVDDMYGGCKRFFEHQPTAHFFFFFFASAMKTKLLLMLSRTYSECFRHGEHFGFCYKVLRGLRRTQEAIVQSLPLKSGMQFAVQFFFFCCSKPISVSFGPI